MTINPRTLLLAATLLLVMMPVAWTEDRAVVLGLGRPSRLMLAGAFEKVIVGNPDIVEVRTDDDRSVVIEPINPGVTNLVFVGAQGRVIANIRVSVCDAPGPNACDVSAGGT
jgi:Flp pilus assembly secretin CpaC